MRRIALLRDGPLDGLQWDWNVTTVPNAIRAVYLNKRWDSSQRTPFDPTNEDHLHYRKKDNGYFYSYSGEEEVHVYYFVEEE